MQNYQKALLMAGLLTLFTGCGKEEPPPAPAPAAAPPAAENAAPAGAEDATANQVDGERAASARAMEEAMTAKLDRIETDIEAGHLDEAQSQIDDLAGEFLSETQQGRVIGLKNSLNAKRTAN